MIFSWFVIFVLKIYFFFPSSSGRHIVKALSTTIICCLSSYNYCGQGNTAVYLLYAHARICSIIRKSGRDIEELKKVSFYSYFNCIIVIQRDFVLFYFWSLYLKKKISLEERNLLVSELWMLSCLKQTGTVVLDHAGERELGLYLLQFSEVITSIGEIVCCSSLDLCFTICSVDALIVSLTFRLLKRPAPTSCQMFCVNISIICQKSLPRNFIPIVRYG